MYMQESLQARFAMVDLKAKQYAIIIRAELEARRERLLAGLLSAPAAPDAIEAPHSLQIEGQGVEPVEADREGGSGNASLQHTQTVTVEAVAGGGAVHGGDEVGAESGDKKEKAPSKHEELLDYRVLNEIAEMVTLMGSKNATQVPLC